MARPQDHVPEHLVVLVSGELPGQRVNGKVISKSKKKIQKEKLSFTRVLANKEKEGNLPQMHIEQI